MIGLAKRWDERLLVRAAFHAAIFACVVASQRVVATIDSDSDPDSDLDETMKPETEER
jgi:hypothetical protein